MTPSPTELAYAAGFLWMAKGCITFASYSTILCERNFYASVSITNNNCPVLFWFKVVFGGGVYKNGKGLPPRKQAWRWVISSSKAEAFLLQVRPFLKVKLEQADLVLNLSEQNLEASINSMHALNQRGV
jgi:hypothetical protein